jgi:hypothetical protein
MTNQTLPEAGAGSPAESPFAAADTTIRQAPLPTDATLKRRASLPAQTLRFAALNARIMRMVLKGHH